MNESPFKISGLERRKLKQELSQLKSLSKSFWYHHQLDKDMAGFYNCQTETYPMSDESAELKLAELKNEIKELEGQLNQIK